MRRWTNQPGCWQKSRWPRSRPITPIWPDGELTRQKKNDSILRTGRMNFNARSGKLCSFKLDQRQTGGTNFFVWDDDRRTGWAEGVRSGRGAGRGLDLVWNGATAGEPALGSWARVATWWGALRRHKSRLTELLDHGGAVELRRTLVVSPVWC